MSTAPLNGRATQGAAARATGRPVAPVGLLDPAFGPESDPGVRALREAVALAERPLPSTVPHDELPLDAVDAPLRRYLGWQLRDFVMQRAVFLVPMALLGLYLAWDVTRRLTGNERGVLTQPEGMTELAMIGMSLFAMLGVPIATFGIVARERERGQQRFLFAKPIGVVPYYLQKLAVGIGGFLTIAVALIALASVVFGHPFVLGEAMAVASALAVMLGGTIFLISTLLRFDAPIAVLMAAANIPLWAMTRDEMPVWALRVIGQVHWLLPPLRALEVFGSRTPELAISPLAAWLWMVGYGMAAIAAGLVVLRKRSITI